LTTKRSKIIIGTRGSKLALWQANWVREKLSSMYPNLQFEIEKIKTTGDKILDAPLAKIGGKGLFVKEIEEALLARKIDLAIHSMKDVPAETPQGLQIQAICEREDPRDVLISKEGLLLNKLPDGSIIGTSSLRRTVQLKASRKDIAIKPLRGNVDTRLKKLKEGEFDGIILAFAGVKRMGYDDMVTEAFPTETIIPAVGQGAIGIETRVDDEFINELIKPLNHTNTAICVLAERAFLSVMGGGCQVPLACHAKIENNSLHLVGMIGDPEEKVELIKGFKQCKLSCPSSSLQEVIEAGRKLATDLLNWGGKEILSRIYSNI
jgi:hydroxymethylbilane synthase